MRVPGLHQELFLERATDVMAEVAVICAKDEITDRDFVDMI